MVIDPISAVTQHNTTITGHVTPTPPPSRQSSKPDLTDWESVYATEPMTSQGDGGQNTSAPRGRGWYVCGYVMHAVFPIS